MTTDHAFKWLESKGYPTAAMSQLEGFTTFLLAPLLAEYAQQELVQLKAAYEKAIACVPTELLNLYFQGEK